MKCDNCGKRIKRITEDDFGDPIDPDMSWEQYLCVDCYQRIWNDLMDECCPVCRDHPCYHGGECWINPWPRIMYLCYVAPRLEGDVHPDQKKLVRK